MARNRVLVQFPPDLIAEIDKIAGAGNRTAFLVELANREVKLYRQRQALRAVAGTWKSEDHPELAQGAAAYVRQLRELEQPRMERIDSRRQDR